MEPYRSRSVRKIVRNKNRGDLCDTVVKMPGSIYKEFLSCKTSNPGENGVEKAHVGPMSHQGAPVGWGGAPWCLVVTRWVRSGVSYFCIFSNIPKLTESIFMEFLESVYLPYHIPLPFQGSGVFRKVSLMYSSGVIVSIILVSTLIGVPEI